MAKDAPRVAKTIHSLDSPFTNPVWYGDRSASLGRDTVTEDSKQAFLIVSEPGDHHGPIVQTSPFSLLIPIGEYRTQCIQTSKEMHNKKRKRSKVQNYSQTGVKKYLGEKVVQEESVPAPPEIGSFLTIGFNSTNQSLEAEVRKSAPMTLKNSRLGDGKGNESSLNNSHEVSTTRKPLVAIFVAQSDQHSAMFSHLPCLVSNVSLAAPTEPAIRLVSLPKDASTRLSAALHLPRVSIIGLRDGAESANSLISYIRDKTSPIEVPWLKDILAGVYLPTEIKTTATTAPVKLNSKSGSKAALSHKTTF